MKKFSLLSFVLFFIPQLCLAGLVKVNIDFWDSAPYVYDGHIVLGGEVDSARKVIGLTDGTIEFGGNTFDFDPIVFTFSDYTSSNWDYIILNLTGVYVDAEGNNTTAWAHFEGIATSFYRNGVLGDESFVDLNGSGVPAAYPGARFSVVDVPEPASFILFVMGFIGLVAVRARKLS